MNYSVYVKNACKKTGLFGHQKNSWDGDLTYPESSQFKEHNHSSCGCRYNHIHNVGLEVSARLNQIRKSPINVSFFSGMDPVCQKHMKVMSWREDDSDGAEFFCPECEHEKKFMNSHPKQMSKEECILEDIYNLDRALFKCTRFNRDDYAYGRVFSKDVEHEIGLLMNRPSIKRFL